MRDAGITGAIRRWRGAPFAAVLLLTTLAVAASFGRACLPGRIVRDASAGQSLYRRATLYARYSEYVLSGHLPQWMPEFQGGYPAAAAWTDGLLYPPVLLFGVLPAETAWAVLCLLHVMLAAAGAWRLMLGLGKDRAGAATAAILLGTSAFLVGQFSSGHLNVAMPFAWVPWILDAIRRTVQRERGGVARLTLTLAAGLLAGHVGIWITVGPFLLVFAVAQAFRARSTGGGRVLLRAVVPGLILGAGIAAVQWVPAIELYTLGARSGQAATASIPTGASLASNLIPGVLGSRPDSAWGLLPVGREGPVLAGLAPLLLALLGLIRLDARRWFWGAVGILGVLAGLGPTNAVGRLAASVPVVSGGGTPGCALGLTALAMAILAGYGVADWREATRGVRIQRLAVAGAGTVVALIVAWVVLVRYSHTLPAVVTTPAGVRTPHAWLLAKGIPALLASAAGAGIVVAALLLRPRWLPRGAALTAALLVGAMLGSMPSIHSVSATFFHHDWRADLPPEALPHRILAPGESILNVEREGGRTFARICDLDVPWFRDFRDGDPHQEGRWLDAGLRVPPPEPVAGGDEFAGPWSLDPETLPALGEAVYFPKAVGGADDEAAMQALATGVDGLYLADLPPEADALAPQAHAPLDIEPVATGDPDRLSFHVDAPAAGWIFFSEKYYPGWTAQVDGEEAPIHRANVVFRAVHVPAGLHRITMRYSPSSWRLGLLIASIALFLLLAGALLHRSFGELE